MPLNCLIIPLPERTQGNFPKPGNVVAFIINIRISFILNSETDFHQQLNSDF